MGNNNKSRNIHNMKACSMLVKSGRQNNNKQCESTHAYLGHLFLSLCRHVDEIWSSALLIKQCLLFWVEYLNCLSNIILISNLPRNICHRKQAFNFYGNIPLILKYNISITYTHSFSDRMLRGVVDFTGLSNNWRYLYGYHAFCFVTAVSSRIFM